jgi:hypothetical protein
MNKPIYAKVSLHNNLIAFVLLLLLGCFAQISAQRTTPDGSGTNTGDVAVGPTSPTALFEIKKSKDSRTTINFDDPFTTHRNSAYSGLFVKDRGANRATGTTRPGANPVMFDNFLAGNITSYTLLYPGYDTQSNVIMELGYGTATANVVPLASLVLSKNLTSGNNAIGVISFANSSIANGFEKRVASIGAATDGAVNSGVLTFGTTNGGLIAEHMRITPIGRIGIGTNNPAEKLEVNGNIKVSGNINAKYQDLAEWVDSAEDLRAGTVVILDVKRPNHVMASTASYDTRVAGVISDRPGITLGEHADGKVLVATTGRVKIKVSANNGPINIGDLLVTSDQTGVAMKSNAVRIRGVQVHRPGTLIGKALEPLAQGTGEILVLLSLQ